MPLTANERRFLQSVDRLKVYLLLLGLTVLLYMLLIPSSELQVATSVIGMALCGIFWLTQRLLSFITTLDLELTRVVNALQRSLPEEQRKELLRSA